MAQLAAFNTMTAIKKKLHGMKQKREEAFDRADQLEQKLIEHRAVSEKVSKSVRIACWTDCCLSYLDPWTRAAMKIRRCFWLTPCLVNV